MLMDEFVLYEEWCYAKLRNIMIICALVYGFDISALKRTFCSINERSYVESDACENSTETDLVPECCDLTTFSKNQLERIL